MKYFVLYILCLIFCTGCKQEKIEVPDTGRKIVINGLITTDQLFNVSLTQSGILTDIDEKYQYTDLRFDAKIYRNNMLVDSLYGFAFDPDASDNFVFRSDYGSKKIIPLPGNEYKIVANVAGFPEASAITQIPNNVKISYIDTVVTFSQNGNFDNHITCNLQVTDPPDEKNYYIIMVKKQIYDIHTPGISEIGFNCPDPVIEEKPQNWIVFSDKIINGKKHQIPIEISCNDFGYPYFDDRDVIIGHGPITIGPPIKKTFYFKLYSITEEFYKYIQTLTLYNKNFGNPLTDPVLMYSNVNGGFGIFSGAAVSVDSLVYDYKIQ